MLKSVKIGIIDSGVGGLSVLLEITRLMPQVDIEYIGDSSWCPYGTKSPEQIQKRVNRHLLPCPGLEHVAWNRPPR